MIYLIYFINSQQNLFDKLHIFKQIATNVKKKNILIVLPYLGATLEARQPFACMVSKAFSQTVTSIHFLTKHTLDSNGCSNYVKNILIFIT